MSMQPDQQETGNPLFCPTPALYRFQGLFQTLAGTKKRWEVTLKTSGFLPVLPFATIPSDSGFLN